MFGDNIMPGANARYPQREVHYLLSRIQAYARRLEQSTVQRAALAWHRGSGVRKWDGSRKQEKAAGVERREQNAKAPPACQTIGRERRKGLPNIRAYRDLDGTDFVMGILSGLALWKDSFDTRTGE